MGKNQPVLRLERGGVVSRLHTKPELYHDSLGVPSLSDETANHLLDSCELEEFAFNDVSELLDNDWSDPHAPLDSLLADSLAGLDDTLTHDSSQDRSNSWPTSSSAVTTVSAIGKESVTSRNSELPEVSTQPRLSSRPSRRAAASSASHSPVPDTAATFLSLYEETRAAYLKELRRLYEFLLNSYKSAGKTPNADGEAKMKELQSLIEFFTPKRADLEAYQLTPDALLRLRHLRDVARAYVQFYRSMKPPTTCKPPRDQELQSQRRQHHAQAADLRDDHRMHLDQMRSSARSPYFDPRALQHHQQPPLGPRPAGSSSSRGPSLHFPAADASSGAGSHPSLSKRAMLQTVAAASLQHPHPEAPRLHHAARGGQRMRMDALKTMPALGYGPPPPQQMQVQMDDLMLMQQLAVMADDHELLQGLGSKTHGLDDLDLLGMAGMGASAADMQGFNELLLDDCLSLPAQNGGQW